MQRIGFPQYTSSLLDYGWKDLELLNELNEQKLKEAGVPEQNHKMVRFNFLLQCNNEQD